MVGACDSLVVSFDAPQEADEQQEVGGFDVGSDLSRRLAGVEQDGDGIDDRLVASLARCE